MVMKVVGETGPGLASTRGSNSFSLYKSSLLGLAELGTAP